MKTDILFHSLEPLGDGVTGTQAITSTLTNEFNAKCSELNDFLREVEQRHKVNKENLPALKQLLIDITVRRPEFVSLKDTYSVNFGNAAGFLTGLDYMTGRIKEDITRLTALQGEVTKVQTDILKTTDVNADLTNQVKTAEQIKQELLKTPITPETTVGKDVITPAVVVPGTAKDTTYQNPAGWAKLSLIIGGVGLLIAVIVIIVRKTRK